MKNRLYIITAFILALILGGGIYAYAYTTGLETINIAEPTGNIATTNATAAQPEWEDILIPVSDTENFRPNAAGDETTITVRYPDTGEENWEDVDEETSDGDSTYVATTSNAWQEDLYSTTNHTTQTAAGPINYVDAYMECRGTANATQTNAYVHIKTNGVEYNGPEENLTLSYDTYSYSLDYNPQTTADWTWDEIDALQVGVGLRRPDVGEYAHCTQVYAEVGFEAPLLSGDTPTDALFEVTPHADYTGDLVVNVYLANTDNVTKAYKYLNMELYLEGSVEAGQTPNYRVLTLENGVVSFTIVDGGSGTHTLSVAGGDYTLNSREPLEWEAGWTVTPELYCEARQR